MARVLIVEDNSVLLDSMAFNLEMRGYETIQARHTCAHRVDELLGICRELKQANPLLLEAR